MPKPKSAKLLCTPLVFERCFLGQPHLPQVPVRLYIRMVDGKGGGEIACSITNPAYDPNAPVPQTGMGKKRRKENKFRKAVKGHLRDAAKVGHVAALGATVAGQPELAIPIEASAATLDILGSGFTHRTPADTEMRRCIEDCRETRNARVRASKMAGSGVVSDTRAKEDKKSKRIRQISEFGDTLRGLGAINKQRRKKVPRYTIKAAKKNSSS